MNVPMLAPVTAAVGTFVPAHFPVQGVVCSVPAHMGPNGGDVPPEILARFINLLHGRGINQIALGEGLEFLGYDERWLLFENWASAAQHNDSPHGLKILADVSCIALKDTLYLARKTATLKGIYGILLKLPQLANLVPPTLEAYLIDVTKAIASEVSRAGLPFMPVYLVLGSQQYLLREGPFVQHILTHAALEGVAGIVNTSADLRWFKQTQRLAQSKQWWMISGCEVTLPYTLKAGTHAVISGIAGCCPAVATLFRCYGVGDILGVEEQEARIDKVHFLLETLAQTGYDSLRMLFLVAGYPVGPTRMPLTDLTFGDLQVLQRALHEGGFLNGAPTLCLSDHTGGIALPYHRMEEIVTPLRAARTA